MAFLYSDETKKSVETMVTSSVIDCSLSDRSFQDIAEVFTSRMSIKYMNVFVRVWCIVLLYWSTLTRLVCIMYQ